MLVASDEECWRHVLGHDVQPGGVQGGAGGASLGQRHGHHHQLRGARVGAKHFSQTEMSANIVCYNMIAHRQIHKYTNTPRSKCYATPTTTSSKKLQLVQNQHLGLLLEPKT